MSKLTLEQLTIRVRQETGTRRYTLQRWGIAGKIAVQHEIQCPNLGPGCAAQSEVYSRLVARF